MEENKEVAPSGALRHNGAPETQLPTTVEELRECQRDAIRDYLLSEKTAQTLRAEDTDRVSYKVVMALRTHRRFKARHFTEGTAGVVEPPSLQQIAAYAGVGEEEILRIIEADIQRVLHGNAE